MIGSKLPWARTSATIRWNEFDPRSNAATRTAAGYPRRPPRSPIDCDAHATATEGISPDACSSRPLRRADALDVTKVMSRDRVEARFGAMGRDARVVVLSGPPRLD